MYRYDMDTACVAMMGELMEMPQQQQQAAAASQQVTPQQQNAYAGAMIRKNGIRISQPIITQTFVPANQNNQLTVNLTQVGLTTDLLVEILATVTVAGACTLTEWGAANILRNVLFVDNYSVQRINTSGRHLTLLGSYKTGKAYGSATTPTSYGIPGFENNYSVMSAPASPGGAGAQTIRAFFHIPFVRNLARDFRGALLTNVTQGSFQLTLTFPSTAQVAVASGDSFNAVYSGSTGSITSMTVTVYQRYFDNLPRVQGAGYLLPQIDLAQYLAITENIWGGSLAANNDLTIYFQPNQEYWSRTLFLDNGATGNTATDVTYFEKSTANYTAIMKNYPHAQALEDDIRIGVEPPLGTWYADYSRKPMTLQVAGNQTLIINIATLNSGAVLLVSDESYIGLAQAGLVAASGVN